jgi:hypothetical protein
MTNMKLPDDRILDQILTSLLLLAGMGLFILLELAK